MYNGNSRLGNSCNKTARERLSCATPLQSLCSRNWLLQQLKSVIKRPAHMFTRFAAMMPSSALPRLMRLADRNSYSTAAAAAYRQAAQQVSGEATAIFLQAVCATCTWQCIALPTETVQPRQQCNQELCRCLQTKPLHLSVVT